MVPCVNWFCFGRLVENTILGMGRGMLDLWVCWFLLAGLACNFCLFFSRDSSRVDKEIPKQLR